MQKTIIALCFIFILFTACLSSKQSGPDSSVLEHNKKLLRLQQELTAVSSDLTLTQNDLTAAREQLRSSSNSLIIITEELNNSNKTITILEKSLRHKNNVLTLLICVIIIRLIGMVIGEALYLKGIKLPRWLDTLFL